MFPPCHLAQGGPVLESTGPDLLQEDFWEHTAPPGLLLPATLTPRQATADPRLCQRAPQASLAPCPLGSLLLPPGFWYARREFQKNIHFCFIDYTKALDCVNHN